MAFKRKLIIGRKIKKICKKYNTKFIINDDVMLSKKLDADGCHLGQKDMEILEARKIIKKKNNRNYMSQLNKISKISSKKKG